jgi:hypothetical protein
MRPRIKKGMLVTSTDLKTRRIAQRYYVEVMFKPMMLGNLIVSKRLLSRREDYIHKTN